METQHAFLIYDTDCPFCSWYTGLFIRTGFLSTNGRLPYNEAIQNPTLHFNHDEARNKIALLNPITGEVKYGIDSMLQVIGTKLPLIRKIGFFPPIHWFLSRFYNFISFNRKIIAPADCNGNCQCVPSTSVFWRIVFIIACGLMVNLATGVYFSQQLNHFFIGKANSDLVFFALQIPFQLFFFRVFKQRNFYDYAGHLAIVSALGAILLIGFHFLLLVLSSSGISISLFQPLCFGVVLTFMFFEHRRRLRLLNLSSLLSITWILFRISIYPFAFNLFVS